MSSNRFRIGTRGSKLALWQANHVAARIQQAFPDIETEIVVIHTTGDKILNAPLSKIGDKGLFTKELDAALESNQVDCCVHSMKDVPTELPEGMVIAAMLERADVRDALVAAPGTTLETLPPGSRVGTGSLRRKAQVRALRPDLELVELRGNLDTRLGRVADGTLDAAILACAGIDRMGWSDRIAQRINSNEMIAAPAQGAIGVQIRENDQLAQTICSAIACPETMTCVAAERHIMNKLEGGCQVPIAAHAALSNDQMQVEAMVASLDGSQLVRTTQVGPASEGISLADAAVAHLIEQGALTILQEAKAAAENQQSPVTEPVR